MKKFICLLLCFVSVFALISCNGANLLSDVNALKDKMAILQDENASLQDEIDALKEREQSKLSDFADCEIGYELEVYPKVAFDYKVNENCVVRIESISATLTAKNVINEDDTIKEAFYPFSIEITITGTANPLSIVRFTITNHSGITGYMFNSEANSSGNFSATETFHLYSNEALFFKTCKLI